MYQVMPDPEPDGDADDVAELARLRLLADQLRLARAQSFGSLREEW